LCPRPPAPPCASTRGHLGDQASRHRVTTLDPSWIPLDKSLKGEKRYADALSRQRNLTHQTVRGRVWLGLTRPRPTRPVQNEAAIGHQESPAPADQPPPNCCRAHWIRRMEQKRITNASIAAPEVSLASLAAECNQADLRRGSSSSSASGVGSSRPAALKRPAATTIRNTTANTAPTTTQNMTPYWNAQGFIAIRVSP
jgi:hypothetical protein